MIYANIVERVKELNNDAWLSLVERCVRDAEVAGSNPVASINWQKHRRSFYKICDVFYFTLKNQKRILQ